MKSAMSKTEDRAKRVIDVYATINENKKKLLLQKEYHTVKIKEIDESLKTIKNKIFKQIEERCKEIKEDGNTVNSFSGGSKRPYRKCIAVSRHYR